MWSFRKCQEERKGELQVKKRGDYDFSSTFIEVYFVLLLELIWEQKCKKADTILLTDDR